MDWKQPLPEGLRVAVVDGEGWMRDSCWEARVQPGDRVEAVELGGVKQAAFLGQRVWMRELLQAWMGKEVVLTRHPDGGLAVDGGWVSLSHSGPFWGVAFSSDYSVGIDLEDVRMERRWEAIASRFFTLSEQTVLSCVRNPDQRVAACWRIWVRKESWVKCRRLPLGRHLRVVETHPECIFSEFEGVQWVDGRAPGVVVACAYALREKVVG